MPIGTYYEAAVTMMLEISPRDFLIPWPSHNVESRHLFASKDSKCTAGEHGGNSLAEVMANAFVWATNLVPLDSWRDSLYRYESQG